MTLDKLFDLLKALRVSGLNNQHLVILLGMRKSPITISDVAKLMGLSAPAASGAVDFLERSGLVKRYHSTENRRYVYVRLTDKGKAIVSRIEETALCF